MPYCDLCGAARRPPRRRTAVSDAVRCWLSVCITAPRWLGRVAPAAAPEAAAPRGDRRLTPSPVTLLRRGDRRQVLSGPAGTLCRREVRVGRSDSDEPWHDRPTGLTGRCHGAASGRSAHQRRSAAPPAGRRPSGARRRQQTVDRGLCQMPPNVTPRLAVTVVPRTPDRTVPPHCQIRRISPVRTLITTLRGNYTLR